jgi:hypothetical protein
LKRAFVKNVYLIHLTKAKSATTSLGVEDRPWMGLGSPLLVSADLGDKND